MALTIACANQKGGVGKTTTVVNLATSLALAGDRVLVVDLDPQGNATSGLGVDREQLEQTVYDSLIDDVPLRDVIHEIPIPGLHLVPSSLALAGAELELVPLPMRERRLTASLGPVGDDYDVILVDSPPSLGLLTVNALTAANGVLSPVQCEYYALEGLTQLLGTIRIVQRKLNPRLAIEGVLLTMYDARLNLARQVEQEAVEYFGDRVYETVIPRNVRLGEAPSFGRPVIHHDPHCAGSEAYFELAKEVASRG